jgi:hypothetical protein
MKFTNSLGETITPAQYFTAIAIQIAGGGALLAVGYKVAVIFFCI